MGTIAVNGSYTTLFWPRGMSLFRHQRTILDTSCRVSHHGLINSINLLVCRKRISDTHMFHLLMSGRITFDLVVETYLSRLKVCGLIEFGGCFCSLSCLYSHETSLLRISLDFIMRVVLSSLKLDQVALDGREATLVAHVGSRLS